MASNQFKNRLKNSQKIASISNPILEPKLTSNQFKNRRKIGKKWQKMASTPNPISESKLALNQFFLNRHKNSEKMASISNQTPNRNWH